MTTPATPTLEHLAAVLRAEMAALGLTQKDVAERIGVDSQTVMRHAGARRDVPFERLVALAGALEMTVTELVARVEQRAAYENRRNVFPGEKPW